MRQAAGCRRLLNTWCELCAGCALVHALRTARNPIGRHFVHHCHSDVSRCKRNGLACHQLQCCCCSVVLCQQVQRPCLRAGRHKMRSLSSLLLSSWCSACAPGCSAAAAAGLAAAAAGAGDDREERGGLRRRDAGQHPAAHRLLDHVDTGASETTHGSQTTERSKTAHSSTVTGASRTIPGGGETLCAAVYGLALKALRWPDVGVCALTAVRYPRVLRHGLAWSSFCTPPLCRVQGRQMPPRQ